MNATATQKTNGTATYAAEPAPDVNGKDLLSQVLAATAKQKNSFDDIQKMAVVTAKSQLFKMTPEQITVLMMISEAEGIPPIMAMLRWDIIDGRPAKKVVTVLAEFLAAGGSIKWVTTTAKVCEAIFSHPRTCPDGVTVRYTIEDAQRANLAGKKNWREDPEGMLTWRTGIRGVRRAYPGAIVGIDPDELPDQPANAEVDARTALLETMKAKLAPATAEATAALKPSDQPTKHANVAPAAVQEPEKAKDAEVSAKDRTLLRCGSGSIPDDRKRQSRDRGLRPRREANRLQGRHANYMIEELFRTCVDFKRADHHEARWPTRHAEGRPQPQYDLERRPHSLSRTWSGSILRARSKGSSRRNPSTARSRRRCSATMTTT